MRLIERISVQLRRSFLLVKMGYFRTSDGWWHFSTVTLAKPLLFFRMNSID
jgi:hypothetical protein